MLRLLILLLISLVVRGQDWELVFEDQFDGGEINQDNWGWEITSGGFGNEEFQVYTPAPENSYVQDGMLFLRPTLLENNINPLTGEVFGPDFRAEGILDLDEMYGEEYGGCTEDYKSGCNRTGVDENGYYVIPPTASARLRSKERFPFRYGKAEVLAKMPVGDWLWPAIWFLPENWCYGLWPTSGEFDLTETIGNEDLYFEDGAPAGLQKMGSTLHWGVNRDENRYYLTTNHYTNETNDYGNYFHLYEVIWSPDGFEFFVDGVRFVTMPDPLIPDNANWEGFFEFGKPWDTIDEDDPEQNPWRINNEPLMTPFDSQFHFLINIAVGGTNGFIPDDAINRGGDPAYAKPWVNGVPQAQGMNEFYDARGEDDSSGWLWTWNDPDQPDNVAMQVEYVRVYKHADLPPEAEEDCPAEL